MKYTEKELVKGCKSNSRKHQHALYETYAGKMFAVCLRYASDQMQAEDFMQEGFVRVFSHIHQFNGDGSFEGWIRRIMVTTALQHLRREKNDLMTVELESSVRIGEEDNTLHQLAVEDIMKLINKLPAGYRAVFNLYVFEELSHKEIAEQLGISEGTSKSQLARARNYLQNLINKNENIQSTRKAESLA